jgi:hypothetical protein
MLLEYNQKDLSSYLSNNFLYYRKEPFYFQDDNFYQYDYVIFHFIFKFFLIMVCILFYLDQVYQSIFIAKEISLNFENQYC